MWPSPTRSAIPVMRSRVTPGMSWTMACRFPTRRLKRVDLPTLGRPTMATVGVKDIGEGLYPEEDAAVGSRSGVTAAQSGVTVVRNAVTVVRSAVTVAGNAVTVARNAVTVAGNAVTVVRNAVTVAGNAVTV